jgi:cyclopropane-fatty-acyl-phospholipid synthase
MQTHRRSLKVANVHYNLDNELYGYMLGNRMSYTCAYWKNADSLEQAQDNKHDLICRKLGLKPGDRVLELGCGWGGFAEFAAKNYGVNLTSVNISSEQINYARERCKGLPIEFFQCDYRDDKTYNPKAIEFDKVVSIGMCEHVGYKNYGLFLDVVGRNLKNHGLFLLHTIGGNKLTRRCEPWTNKYIFPNGVLPSIAGLGKAMEKEFVMEDWHNFGAYYDLTLMAWYHNFVANWDKFKSRYDERFYRMFSYYLLSCAGMFRARKAELWQVVMSKGGVPGMYEAVR